MINSFKAEWRKLRQRPAVWVLGGIMLAALILFGYAFNWIQLSFPSKNFHPEGGLTIAQLKTALYPINFVKNSLQGVGIVGSILTLIMGALVVGSEFGWGTVKTVYTQRPGRLQALAGQVGVVSVIAAIFTVAFYAVAALASSAIALGDGATITWPAAIDILKALGAFDAGWVTTIEKLFLGQNAGALIKSFGQPFASPGAAAPIVTAGVAVLVLAVYALVFAGVSSLVVRTRDVT